MLRVLAAWNAAGWLYIALLGAMMFRCEVAGIRKQASLEDESRSAILVLTVLASAATMVAVGAQLSGLSKAKGLEGTALFTLSFSTILVSWFLVHFVFALYYAHEFHSETRRSGGSGAGFDFHGQQSPDYLDFLYLSLVIGTTAQTSDINITSRETRRTVMLHGLLSFFFNTTVIALVVNLTAQFASLSGRAALLEVHSKKQSKISHPRTKDRKQHRLLEADRGSMDVRFWHIADFRESPLMSANAYSGLFAAFMGAVAAQLQSV